MALFDNLGKKISDASQKTISKTKEIADISKINSQIYEQEKLINETYSQLGKAYYEKYKDSAEEEMVMMVNFITETYGKIDELNTQILEIKGVRHCPNCGGEVANNSAFCSACGTPMPKVEAKEEVAHKCANCGTKLDPGMRFCASCGTPVKEEAPVEEVVEAAVPQVCSNCGAPLTEGMAFCGECGTKV